MRAINAMDTAPAVCELEGPIIFGPITSKYLKIHNRCPPVVSSFSIAGNEKKLQGLAREKFIENFLFENEFHDRIEEKKRIRNL